MAGALFSACTQNLWWSNISEWAKLHFHQKILDYESYNCFSTVSALKKEMFSQSSNHHNIHSFVDQIMMVIFDDADVVDDSNILSVWPELHIKSAVANRPDYVQLAEKI